MSQLPFGGNGAFDRINSLHVPLLRVGSQLPFGGNGAFDTTIAMSIGVLLTICRNCLSAGTGLSTPFKGVKLETLTQKGRNCLSAGTGLSTNGVINLPFRGVKLSQLPFGGNGAFDVKLEKRKSKMGKEIVAIAFRRERGFRQGWRCLIRYSRKNSVAIAFRRERGFRHHILHELVYHYNSDVAIAFRRERGFRQLPLPSLY